MSAKIRYRSVRLTELITETAGEGIYADCPFVKLLSENVRAGIPPAEAWESSAANAVFLGSRDRELLYSVGAGLGSSDTEGQLSMLALGSSMLQKALAEAENEYSRKGSTMLGVWTLCGIGAGILIL